MSVFRGGITHKTTTMPLTLGGLIGVMAMHTAEASHGNDHSCVNGVIHAQLGSDLLDREISSRSSRLVSSCLVTL